jgi:hypothetical protein
MYVRNMLVTLLFRNCEVIYTLNIYFFYPHFESPVDVIGSLAAATCVRTADMRIYDHIASHA